MHNLLKYAYEPNVRLSTYTKKHHGTEFPPYWIEGLLYLDPWFLLGYETQKKKTETIHTRGGIENRGTFYLENASNV